MDDLNRLETRIASLTELRDLFVAMRALSASRVQTAQSALAGARAYAETIERSIADAVLLQPTHGPSVRADFETASAAIVVICSEHGFAGAYNRLLLERAHAAMEASDTVLIVGRRGGAMSPEHGIEPSSILPMATHVDGLLDLARRIATRVGTADIVRVVFGKYGGSGRFEADVRQIAPLPPERLLPQASRSPPLHQLPPRALLKRLIGELLLAELMLTLTESFVSENAARLQVMQTANHNIESKLEVLTRASRQLRQEAITSELLEVIVGGDAVSQSGA